MRAAEHTILENDDRAVVLASLAELGPAARGDAVAELLASMCAAVTDLAPEFDEPLYLRSLEAVDLRSRIELTLGVSVPLDELLDDSTTLRELSSRVAADTGHSPAVPVMPAEPARPDMAARHDPFPLTGIQQAYLLGRSGAFDLGGVATHYYAEFDCDDLDLARLSVALRMLIERHDMLRAVIHPDGYQRILDEVPPYEIAATDVTGEPAASRLRHLDEARKRMSHQVHQSDRWPLFEVTATRLSARRTRLHVSIDLLIADGASIGILFREWSELYGDLSAPLLPLDLSFRDYVLATARLKDSTRYTADRDYWLRRITELPGAPELPLTTGTSGSVRFVRRRRAFTPGSWARLRDRANRAGLTPSALLCAAYADVLATWSKDQRFTLNVTLGERLPLHPQVAGLVGDFTSSIPLAVDASGTDAFDERAAGLQRQLRRDLEHRLFGGVEVARELARAGGGTAARLPVVFTSLLGVAAEGSDAGPFGTQVFAVSQTPQVILDNQVLDRAGQLEVSWDAVEDRFQPGVLDAMFEAYCGLLTRLAGGDQAAHRGDLVPAQQAGLVADANATAWTQPTRLLHGPVADRAAERPSAPAVIDGERVLSYGELDVAANRLARLLRRHGAGRGQLVGVVMDKGWQQVVAVLAVLRAGAAYLPVDAGLPRSRVHHLLERGEVRLALTQAAVAERLNPGWPAGLDWFAVDGGYPGDDGSPLDEAAGPDDLAYVIFTSGSTGEPKGVMITHRGAANTVADVNDRFAVDAADRVLAVSSLSFDLSVWDIFGMLTAGGTVVIPSHDASRDPARWAELIRRHGVTVWNSVPALLGLVADYAGDRPEAIGGSPRLALLSGDWVPVELPDRVRALVPAVEVVSLGGATEGSIWSILHPVRETPPGLTSIPYGRAMRNQQMHVLDRDLEPRPIGVPGEIFIGGTGVAAGYWRDEEKTARRFIHHQLTGNRLYRTGDLGRYRPDGDIEFLGREDSQVKIRGYRVELGEIEAVLAEHPAITGAAVTAPGPGSGPRRLVAHYVPAGTAAPADDDLRTYLAGRLPDYMVPTAFVTHDALPLTGNGKVDRGALADPSCPLEYPRRQAGQQARPGPDDQHAETLTAIWQDVLGGDPPGRADDFLLAGGDSLLALRFVAKAGAAGIRLRPQDILEGLTFAELVRRAEPARAPDGQQGLVTGDTELTPNQRWFLEQDFAEAHHWNGMWPLLSVGERLDPVLLGAAVHRLLLHHDALRTRFRRTADGWRAGIGGADQASPVPFSVIDVSAVPDDDLDREVGAICSRLQASLDLENGPVVRVTYLDLGPGRPGRLHIAAHWITLDYYSSRIFFEDLRTVYVQLRDGLEPRLPAKGASVVDLGRAMREKAQTPVPGEEIYWLDPVRHEAAAIPLDHELGPDDQGSARRILAALTEAETAALTGHLIRENRCEVREVLLLALGRALAEWTGRDLHLIDVEGHGREDLVGDLDISRTISRYSTIWPLLLRVPPDCRGQALGDVVRQVRRPRDRGAWHGMLRYLSEDAELRSKLAEMPSPGIGFNYWGQVDEYFTDTIWPSPESPGPHRGGAGHRYRPLDVLGFLAGGELAMVWSYSPNLHREDTIRGLAERTMAHLRTIIGADESDPAAARAVAIDEERPLQRDGRWRLAGLGMQRSE